MRPRRRAACRVTELAGGGLMTARTAATYDAIVVGGGHNGLVAAAYLARSGARTVVLEAMPRWDAWLAGLAEVRGPLLLTVPPAIGSRRPRDLAGTLRLAWRHRGLDVRTVADVTRLMTMSIADLLDDWFCSPQVKAALAVNGVIGTWAGPYEPGTAYVMAHHSIGDVGDGHLGNWGFQEGGMGAVADAIVAAARSFGVEIRTNATVSRILVKDGRARGVELDNGQQITARVVVTS